MSGHEQYRRWSAAYVLGALDSRERRDFEDHLAHCSECQGEVQYLAPIPGLLARVEGAQQVSAPPAIEERALGRVRSEWSELTRSRRRWRVIAAAAVVATVLAVSGLVPPSGTPLVFAEGALASGKILVEERAWGTEVFLELEGLPPSDSYTAWVIDQEGRWYQVAVWGPTPNASAAVTGASLVAFSDVDRIVVTTGDREQPIVEAWPEDA